jgi:hypothetical protein
MGEPVEQSASEAFGAEHLGPFGKRQDLSCHPAQPGKDKFPALCPGGSFAVANLTRCLMSVAFECLCSLQASILGFGAAM